jgi:DNA-binding transcriptional LysR family regulator
MGRQPVYVFQSDDNTTIQGCVGAGLGYALLPRLAIDPDDPAVRVVALDPPPAPRVLGLAWSSDRNDPPAVEAFLDCVYAACDGLTAASLAGAVATG